MSEVETVATARLADPLSFTFPDSKVLYADQLEARIAGIQDLVLLFAPLPRRGPGRSTSTGRFISYAAHAPYSTTVAYGRSSTPVRRPTNRRIRVHAIHYNSPLEIVIQIPFPLLASGTSATALGTGYALLRFWKKFTEARVVHAQGSASVARARAEAAAWDAIREQLDLPEDKQKLPKEQRQRVNNAIKFVTAVEDIKVVGK